MKIYLICHATFCSVYDHILVSLLLYAQEWVLALTDYSFSFPLRLALRLFI